MGYGGMELSLVRGLTSILAMDYLDDYMINKINECQRRTFIPDYGPRLSSELCDR